MPRESSSKEKIVEAPSAKGYVKCRHVLAIMLFWGMFNVYSLRVNLSVAIVAMVNTNVTGRQSITMNVSDACPDDGRNMQTDDIASNDAADWDAAQQGLLLGCFYYGYIFSGVPGGYLANRFGVKPTFGIPLLLSAIITLLTPVLASAGFQVLVAGRVLLGFLQGFNLPAMQASWGEWAPPIERTRLVSSSFAGMGLGIFASMMISGIVAENLGWEAVFYVTGGLALLWSCIWFGIIHSWPETHPRISIQEKTYIMESINEENTQKMKHPSTPWLSLAKSLPVWAIVMAHSCLNFWFYVLLTMLPTYMATMLRFNLSKSGSLSAVPYILHFFVAISTGNISDDMIRRGYISTVNVRKLNTALAAGLSGSLLVLAGYVGCNIEAAVALFSLAVAFNGLSEGGFQANAVDIAPAFSGIIYGISNTIANVPGFVAPQVTGLMLQADTSFQQWRNVFWMAAVVFWMGTLFYLVFASAEKQTWAINKNSGQCEVKEISVVGTESQNQLSIPMTSPFQ